MHRSTVSGRSIHRGPRRNRPSPRRSIVRRPPRPAAAPGAGRDRQSLTALLAVGPHGRRRRHRHHHHAGTPVAVPSPRQIGRPRLQRHLGCRDRQGLLDGSSSARDLQNLSALIGERDEFTDTISIGDHGSRTRQRSTRRVRSCRLRRCAPCVSRRIGAPRQRTATGHGPTTVNNSPRFTGHPRPPRRSRTAITSPVNRPSSSGCSLCSEACHRPSTWVIASARAAIPAGFARLISMGPVR